MKKEYLRTGERKEIRDRPQYLGTAQHLLHCRSCSDFWCHYLLTNQLFSKRGGLKSGPAWASMQILSHSSASFLRIAGRESPEESWQCHSLRWGTSILQRTPERLLPPQICARGEVLPARGSETERVVCVCVCAGERERKQGWRL